MRPPKTRLGATPGRLLLLMLCAVAAASRPTIASMAASSSPPPPAGEQLQVIGVDALMRSPDKYPGTVRVRGVVISVFPDEQRLGLLDAIYLNCCSSPCGSLQALPVKWAGDMPPAKTMVLVTGEIRRTGKKLEFVAAGIEKAGPDEGAAP